MLLSEDKISHLSHLILSGLRKDSRAILRTEEERILREIKRVILQELQYDEQIDQRVRDKLASYSRPLPEGSPEWEVLYHKFFAEEQKKRKR